MKNERSGSRSSHSTNEKRDSQGRSESGNMRGSHSSSGRSGQKRDSEGRFTSNHQGNSGRKKSDR